MFLPPNSFHRLHAVEDAVTIHSYTPAPANPVEDLPLDIAQQLDAAREVNEAGGDAPGVARLIPFVSRRPQIVSIVRSYLGDWAERETQANLDGLLSLPADTVADFRSSGVLSAPIPEEQGGWGNSLEEAAEALRLVAQVAPATALALVMPLGNAATTRIPEDAILSGGRASLAKGKAWIVEQVQQGRILAVANSEPGSGGDLANTKTTAERGFDGVYRLTGRKSFATFGRDADYFLCAARHISGARAGKSQVDGFFVSREAAGLAIDDRWNPVGMRPTASVGLTLENAPADSILGYPGCLEGINARHWSTVLFAAVFLGLGEGALQEGVKNTPSTAIWSRAALAECSLSLDAAAGFIQSVAASETWLASSEFQERTRRAKTFVSRSTVETATKVAMISGGRAYTPQHTVFRYLCDALAGPLLRPPLPNAMDGIVKQLFAESTTTESSQHVGIRAAA